MLSGYTSFWADPSARTVRPSPSFFYGPPAELGVALAKALTECTSTVLPAGPCRIVHVLAKAVRERLEGGTRPPLVAVRTVPALETASVYRHVEVLGPAGLWDLADPVPGTDGRGICVLVTTSALRVWTDRAPVTEGH